MESSAVAFNVKDICRIMSTARDLGVSEFQGCGISFKLGNASDVRASVQTNITAPAKPKPPKDLDTLLIEDPAAFEQALREIE